MSTFDDREKNFENKYVRDEELAFKINARRNKLLGFWAAEKLGKQGQAAEEYAKEVVASDFEKPGSDDVIGRLLADFYEAGVTLTAQAIKAEMERLLPIARKQIMGDRK